MRTTGNIIYQFRSSVLLARFSISFFSFIYFPGLSADDLSAHSFFWVAYVTYVRFRSSIPFICIVPSVDMWILVPLGTTKRISRPAHTLRLRRSATGIGKWRLPSTHEFGTVNIIPTMRPAQIEAQIFVWCNHCCRSISTHRTLRALTR